MQYKTERLKAGPQVHPSGGRKHVPNPRLLNAAAETRLEIGLNAKKVGPYGASNRNGSMKGSTSPHLMYYWGSDKKRLICGYSGLKREVSRAQHRGRHRGYIIITSTEGAEGSEDDTEDNLKIRSECPFV